MADAPTPQEPPSPQRPRFFWPGGLSARLLTLTILFVLLAGLVSLPPILAAFEEQWLLDRARAAELASLAPEVAPDRKVSEQLKAELLRGAGVEIVAISNDRIRSLVFAGPKIPTRAYLVDLRGNVGLDLLAPFRTLFSAPGSRIRVMAEPRFRKADFVEFVAPDAELKKALIGYLWRVLLVIGFVSAVAGLLVYLTLNLFLVRPMQRITYAMERFRADPEDPQARVPLSGRRDEIGRAEAELDRMQADLRAALSSRARLAALGEAVAKINHDLKNMLTSAQIASERLAALKDPKVSQALPRLERALDRAVKLASGVLAYGKTQEAAPEPRALALAPALEAAAEEARLGEAGVRLVSQLAAEDQVLADPDQLHRILTNLLRNAREAIEHQEGRRRPGKVTVSVGYPDGATVIRIADNGPGLPERARERLFQPFAGSGRPDGAGLGLAIARELAQGHGGDLALVESGSKGAVFELRLPGAPGAAETRGRPARSSA
ncbi:MAG TPA: HAMP domain-containing sensor histidine kinase [Phenylobacterium sp.]|uniref:sensor histidine kinase n=1 Tax=Phenylobacterium sp. TaxID=1871053 RepID=UPI002C897AB7|nr:HAMP domain-containing sensor histidine kinase [Phenylobacterium sp.]HSV04366.1 HAMP domain-containing sensor histidine kinase [Phenylobacterium sp.]